MSERDRAPAGTLAAREYHRRRETVAGWQVEVASYQLGDQYVCEIANADVGARLARRTGASRADAERKALDRARALLSRTRVRT